MILILGSTILKMSFGKTFSVLLITVATALFTYFAWHLAAEQSKTQIADWLANPTLMADIAVLITLEVALHISFCVMSLSNHGKNNQKKIKRIFYNLLKWFPGVLYLVVIFAFLTSLILVLPGVSFSTVSLIMALSVLVLLPLLTFLSKLIISEEYMRLELLFLVNLLIALLGIIATVNGRTTMTAVNNVNWLSLLGVMAIVLIGTSAGFLWRRIYFRLKEKKKS